MAIDKGIRTCDCPFDPGLTFDFYFAPLAYVDAMKPENKFRAPESHLESFLPRLNDDFIL
jgi:hypothetical protein